MVSASSSSAASISRSRAIQHLHLLTRRLELLHELVGRLAGALSPGDLVARGVALGFQGFDAHQQLAALAVELEDGIERVAQRRIAASHQPGATAGRILPEALEVDHT